MFDRARNVKSFRSRQYSSPVTIEVTNKQKRQRIVTAELEIPDEVHLTIPGDLDFTKDDGSTRSLPLNTLRASTSTEIV